VQYDLLGEPITFPRTCRVTIWWVLVCGALGSSIVAFGLLSLRFAVLQLTAGNGAFSFSALQLALVTPAATGMGLWFIISPLLYRIVIDKGSITEYDIFRRRHFVWSEIAGKKDYPLGGAGSSKGVIIYPVDREILPLRIEIHLLQNTAWLREWLKSSPDLRASPHEWHKHIRRLQRMKRIATAGSVGFPIVVLLCASLGQVVFLALFH
jgi:hypothetical protein